MGLRFTKRIKLFPGVSLNLSKSGVSVSAGPRGAKVTVGPKGVRKTIGIPGTGISHTEYTKYDSVSQAPDNTELVQAHSTNDKALGCGVMLLVGFALAVCYSFFK